MPGSAHSPSSPSAGPSSGPVAQGADTAFQPSQFLVVSGKLLVDFGRLERLVDTVLGFGGRKYYPKFPTQIPEDFSQFPRLFPSFQLLCITFPPFLSTRSFSRRTFCFWGYGVQTNALNPLPAPRASARPVPGSHPPHLLCPHSPAAPPRASS